MPTGAYLHLDIDDGTPVALERFSCAPGPAGWRYASTLLDPDSERLLGHVDVTVDARWRQLRVEVASADWVVRGGLTGSRLTWLRLPADCRPDTAADGARGPSAGSEQAAVAAGFTGRSPGLLVATARLLALSAGGRARLPVVLLTEPALAARLVEQAWAHVELASHATDTGALVVEHYSVADLDTGRAAALHLAGDVVLAGPGLELTELTGPPTPIGTAAR